MDRGYHSVSVLYSCNSVGRDNNLTNFIEIALSRPSFHPEGKSRKSSDDTDVLACILSLSIDMVFMMSVFTNTATQQFGSILQVYLITCQFVD